MTHPHAARAIAHLAAGEMQAAEALFLADNALADFLAEGLALVDEGERVAVEPPLPELPRWARWRLVTTLLAAAGRATEHDALFVESTAGWPDLAPLRHWTALTSLGIDGLGPLSDLSPIAALPKLEMLSLRDARAVTQLPALASTLQQLSVEGVPALTRLPPAETLAQLRFLELTDATALADTRPLAACTSLRTARLGPLAAGSDLSFLGRWEGIVELELDGLTGLSDLSALAGCGGLVDLSLRELADLVDLSALSELPLLQRLSVGLSPGAAALDLRNPHLAMLSLHDLSALETLRLELPALTALFLDGCAALSRLEWHGAGARVERLQLPDGIHQLEIHGVAGLETLTLPWCDHLVLQGLPDLHTLDIDNRLGLERLELRALPALEAVPALSTETYVDLVLEDLPAVRSITERHNEWMNSIRICGLPALETLDLHDSACSPVVLADLPALRHLDLHGHTPVANGDMLAALTTLETLELGRCSGLTRLDLSAAPGLTTLHLRDCTGLRELILPPSVTTLDLSGCAALEAASWPQGGALQRLLAGRGAPPPALATWPAGVPVDTLDLTGARGPLRLPGIAVRHLCLSDASGVEELAGLAALRGLSVVDLGRTPVTDLSPLAVHAGLTEVRVSRHRARPSGCPHGVTLTQV